ncbi:hypothetical protein FXO37_18556 [Capsicum annuum]|nr:hypothetical protein FXO37_18556 [Capsicum annuum]
MVELILQTVKPKVEGHHNDRPWWMENTNGQFSLKSSWEVIQKKKEKRRDFDYIWNKDGACRGNPGMSSYDFFIRNERGDLVYARAKGLGLGTNTEDESTDIKEALEYCHEKLYTKFIIETDSLSLKHMILKQWKIPWELVAAATKEIKEHRKEGLTVCLEDHQKVGIGRRSSIWKAGLLQTQDYLTKNGRKILLLKTQKKILQMQHFSPEKSEADIKNSTKIHHGFSLNTTQRRRERSFEFQWQQSGSTLEDDNVKGKWKIKCEVVFKLI